MVSFAAYESITVEVENDVATIELHRPEKHNALSTEVLLDLQRAFNEINLDRSIDAVIITGEGTKAFSAGADIEQYAGPAQKQNPRQKDRQALFYDIYQLARQIHPVTIAKINGYCVGGGLILAMYCDLRIAIRESQFGIPTTDLGQIPGGGGTYRAVQLVGEAKAKELVFTAGLIDGTEAHRIGLVNRLTEDFEELDEIVDRIVTGIQNTGRQAVKNSKRSINRAADLCDPETAREHEANLWWDQFQSEERQRLVDDFIG